MNNKLEQLGFQMLEKLGFKMDSKTFGIIEPEAYSVGKDHFKPTFRHVFVGEAKGGYYVTSHINGSYRGYRCRNSYETEVANIFGKGKTKIEAITDFVSNFTTKTYNVR